MNNEKFTGHARKRPIEHDVRGVDDDALKKASSTLQCDLEVIGDLTWDALSVLRALLQLDLGK